MSVNLCVIVVFMILKYNIKFILEKRKNKATDELIIHNVPIYLDFTYQGKRLKYFIGYRIDKKDWDDKSEKVQKNVINQDGISASLINHRISLIKTNIEEIYFKIADLKPSVSELREKLKQSLLEDENITASDFWVSFKKYIEEADVSYGYRKHLESTMNHFKSFAEETHISIQFDKINHILIEKFVKSIKSNSERPISINTLSGILKRLRGFFIYARKNKWITTNPFDEISIESEKYGDPIYLTKEERDILFYSEISDEKLAWIRDMFCLQSFIGCRVSDLVKLTKQNIIGDFIQYIPQKTKGEKQNVVSVPLIQKAKEIIGRYNMPDDTLMPFISGQKYNDNLRILFKKVGLNRPVVRLNPLTREDEIVPLHKIASSHMARRTFIGILHKTEKNEVIASMSGHTVNSKAFSRYYKVDDESKLSAVKAIE